MSVAAEVGSKLARPAAGLKPLLMLPGRCGLSAFIAAVGVTARADGCLAKASALIDATELALADAACTEY